MDYEDKMSKDSTREDFAVFHRRFLVASRMKKSFEDLLIEVSKGTIESDHPDISTFLYFWYASLHTLVEGWRQLPHFTDHRVDELINISKFPKMLKNARDKIYHYNRSYYPAEIHEYVRHEGSVAWARALFDAFNNFCLNELKKLK